VVSIVGVNEYDPVAVTEIARGKSPSAGTDHITPEQSQISTPRSVIVLVAPPGYANPELSSVSNLATSAYTLTSDATVGDIVKAFPVKDTKDAGLRSASVTDLI